MRVAVLSDIHGNLPALEAVLADVEREAPDAIVLGGDVAAGPLPRETLDRLAALETLCAMGNGDRAVVEAYRGIGADGQMGRVAAWVASQLDEHHIATLAAYAPTVSLDVGGLGPVLFCHGTPRSDTEMLTMLTGRERLAPMVEGVTERVIVCGHTHHQFDRVVSGRRLVGAGAVGMPYQGEAAAFWALLGPDVELRRTAYDVPAALETMRAGGLPDVDELVFADSLVDPITAETAARWFEPPA